MPLKSPVERTCKVCGRPFTTRSAVQVACSEECRRLRKLSQIRDYYHAKARREGRVSVRRVRKDKTATEKLPLGTCPHCGGVFLRNGGTTQKCPCCGASLRKPIEGIDTPPPDAVRFQGLLLPPDALQRLLKLRKWKRLNGTG